MAIYGESPSMRGVQGADLLSREDARDICLRFHASEDSPFRPLARSGESRITRVIRRRTFRDGSRRATVTQLKVTSPVALREG